MPIILDDKKTDLIEAAMNRAWGEASRGEQDFLDSRTMVFRREQDQALKQRLDQLENALHGEVVHSAQAPEPVKKQPAQAVAQVPYQPAALLLIACASALGGAAMAWLVLGDTARLPAHTASAVIVPEVQKTSLVAVTDVVPAALDDGKAEVLNLLEGWRQAWQRRDVDAYLGHYSPDFVPANGQTLAAWRKGRHSKLASQSSISVGIKEVRSDRIGAEQIKVSFLQDYKAGKYEERGQAKTLLVQLRGNKWQIAGEWQGDKKE